MNEKTIQMESMTYQFLIHEDKWQLKLPKSQTRVNDIRQMVLINQDSDLFVPSFVEEEDDKFIFTFMVDPHAKQWEDIRKLDRKDKLRLLCNLARFRICLTTRITFFMHPDHLIVDDNLIPSFVYRGIRDVVPPYQFDEETFLFQYKCLIVALFSKKYRFDELYAGSLNHAKDTEFDRQIGEIDDLDALIKLLNIHYIQEKMETEKKMQIVPKKQFRLFKQLTFIMISLSVLLTIVLIYLNFVKVPYQGHLLEANRYFLSLDYGNVIHELEDENPEKLPSATKYTLAYSYIKSERLSNVQKETILKNISIKSDPNYLLYWIYNGRGDFNRTIDIAKFIDDPQLIMYGLIKQIEGAKNDPTLSGTEREKRVQNYEEQYKSYAEKYSLDPDTSDPAGLQDPNQMKDPKSQ
ncbi:type VII secretion protein EssB [Neobacillus vireti]|uniref:type VII secretion protein EssB n=1 Tax=Neobacillus vireti TaxID=220686 RepID=UPI002FFDF77E